MPAKQATDLFATVPPQMPVRYTVIDNLHGKKAVLWSATHEVTLDELIDTAKREFAGVPLSHLEVRTSPLGLTAL